MITTRCSFRFLALGLVAFVGCLGTASAQVPPPATGIQWSTYLGGQIDEDTTSVAVGPQGEVVVVGVTNSPNFPVTGNAYMPSDPTNQWKAFITVFDSTGSNILYSTFIGGSGDEEALDVDVDDQGVITVLGVTTSLNFPTTPGAFQTVYNGNGSPTNNDLFLVRLDRTLPPSQQLLYSTYLGGSGSELVSFFNWYASGGKAALWVDDAGVVTIVTETNSPNFPTTAGAFQSTLAGGYDGVVAAINPQGNGAADLLYATYLGGYHHDHLYDVHVDATGVVTVVGATQSPNFPTTSGAYDPTFNGQVDALLAQFQPVGGGGTILLYSTCLGHTEIERALALAEALPTGRFVVSGYTFSPNFPTTAGAYDTSLNNNGNTTYYDGFVSVIDPAGLGSLDLKYSTFLGGNFMDAAMAVRMNSTGEVLATGFTGEFNPPLGGVDPQFPVTLGAADTSYNNKQDVYVARLRPEGQGTADLVYSTLLGGSSQDFAGWLFLLNDDEVILTGDTTSTDFPATGYQTASAGSLDGIVMRVDLRAHACGTGNVDASKAPVSDVLLVNGSSWSASGRVASVLKTNPFTIQMLAPPSKPAGPAKFALYAWNASPNGSEHDQPAWLGRTCLPTPLNVGVMPQPIKIANNVGKPALGVENWPGPPTVPAPCVLLNRPGGIGKTLTFYLQGFLVDAAAPNGKAAVTNGITVVSQ